MKLISPSFGDNESIPSKYTCDGENINPPLLIEDVPEKAQSLLLIVEDPDVPKTVREDGVWDHWLVWNIEPDIKEIPENTEPYGVVGKNTSGTFSYTGPCPPDREHRYFFKLFALDIELHVEKEATKQDLLQAMDGHVLDKTELIGLYERQL